MTGRCYCGVSRIETKTAPHTVALCHCTDCRRVTGSPAPVFAAFKTADVTLSPAHSPAKPVTSGVQRWFCPDCGSQLMATFDYLPGQIYVPTGVLDDGADLEPDLQCHAENAADWLHVTNAPGVIGTARATLLQD